MNEKIQIDDEAEENKTDAVFYEVYLPEKYSKHRDICLTSPHICRIMPDAWVP